MALTRNIWAPVRSLVLPSTPTGCGAGDTPAAVRPACVTVCEGLRGQEAWRPAGEDACALMCDGRDRAWPQLSRPQASHTGYAYRGLCGRVPTGPRGRLPSAGPSWCRKRLTSLGIVWTRGGEPLSCEGHTKLST